MPRREIVSLDTNALVAANGCWIIVYEDEGFNDTSLLITGPVDYGNLRGLPNSNGKDWGDDIDSLVVGPNCWLQVFADENFGDTSAWYGPNSHIPGLGDLGDEIDSIKLYTSPPVAYFEHLRRKFKANQEI